MMLVLFTWTKSTEINAFSTQWRLMPDCPLYTENPANVQTNKRYIAANYIFVADSKGLSSVKFS